MTQKLNYVWKEWFVFTNILHDASHVQNYKKYLETSFLKNVQAYKMFPLPFSTYYTYSLKSKLEKVFEYPSGYCRDSEGIKLRFSQVLSVIW